MLRADAIRARLPKLKEVVSRLQEIRSAEAPAGPGSFRDAWAAERGLQLGAEIMLDIGNHILSAHFGVSAEDHEDVIVQLERCGVIPHDLRERLKGLGGFRNILVLDYLRLDPDRVAAHLARAPRDFSDFAGVIRRWLDTVRAT